MKKLLTILVLLGLILVVTMPDALLWCKKLILDEPTIHQVDAGEYLSKISLQYYGNAKYWRELALINRAPDSDLIFPGEDIFIPTREVIEQLHRARSLSKVNSLVDEEKQLYAQNQIPETEHLVGTDAPPTAESGTVIKSEKMVKLNLEPEIKSEIDEKSSSSSTLIFSIIGGSIFLAAVAFLIFLKKNETQDTETDDETEPDYRKYKASRSKRVYV